jgi:hypothetical protein
VGGEVREHQVCDGLRGLALREVADAVEHHPVVVVEVALEAL